jgi:aminopeptidase N
MIINSDERQWTWMDEGLNTFVQYLTEKEWDRNYPTRRGPARNIVDYMGGDKSRIEPIMTNSESIWQFGNNAYGKPATALNILRETVMGRELFDYSFKEYCRRWAFRHPSPADFFRTMEDASAVDLDWFWRGWFFTTDHVDISLDEVKWMQIDTRNPKNEAIRRSKEDAEKPMDISLSRDRKQISETYIEKDPSLHDYYTQRNPYAVTTLDELEYQEFLASLTEEEKAFLNSGKNFYEITFKNIGGLVMPLILRFEYTDGTEEIRKIPAEIWKMSTATVTKIFVTDKEVLRITLDPYLETADTDITNNAWPAAPVPSRFQMFKETNPGWQEENPMQRERRNEQLEGGKK